VQVVLTAADLGGESRYQVDVIIMATSREERARVANQTSAAPPPMIEDVQQTTLSISLNEGTIVLCAEHEISIGTVCVCAAGYTRPGATCVGCAPGTAKAADGDAACGACSGNTFSGTGAALCAACPLSATTRQNHTGCACNTGFVFFNGVCTQTEDVYLNVSVVLQMPDGVFSEQQLEDILLDGWSTYLNFSRQFITVIVRLIESTNSTETEGSNATGANTTDTATARRLLYALTADYNFTVLFQIPSDDQEAYAKIENYLVDFALEAAAITDRNGYRIVPREAELVPGFFSADGIALALCASGLARFFDSLTETLRCPDSPAPDADDEGAPAWVSAVVVFGVAALAGAAVAVYRYKKCVDSASVVIPVALAAPGFPLEFDAAGLCLFPPRLQFPATVTFEYQLLTGHSV
jgi:hypothetical protein